MGLATHNTCSNVLEKQGGLQTYSVGIHANNCASKPDISNPLPAIVAAEQGPSIVIVHWAYSVKSLLKVTLLVANSNQSSAKCQLEQARFGKLIKEVEWLLWATIKKIRPIIGHALLRY